eukprot:4089863-Pleurochrysis_carterae.AAC.1
MRTRRRPGSKDADAAQFAYSISVRVDESRRLRAARTLVPLTTSKQLETFAESRQTRTHEGTRTCARKYTKSHEKTSTSHRRACPTVRLRQQAR